MKYSFVVFDALIRGVRSDLEARDALSLWALSRSHASSCRFRSAIMRRRYRDEASWAAGLGPTDPARRGAWRV